MALARDDRGAVVVAAFPRRWSRRATTLAEVRPPRSACAGSEGERAAHVRQVLSHRRNFGRASSQIARYRKKVGGPLSRPGLAIDALAESHGMADAS